MFCKISESYNLLPYRYNIFMDLIRNFIALIFANTYIKMIENLTATAAIFLDATPAQVWEGLTNPELINQYLFDTKVTSEWKEGQQITWKGMYKGKAYEDTGMLLKMEPNKRLQHTYLSALSRKEDKPENYDMVIYTITVKEDATLLTVTQNHSDTEIAKERSTKNWQAVLEKLKKVVENKVIHADKVS